MAAFGFLAQKSLMDSVVSFSFSVVEPSGLTTTTFSLVTQTPPSHSVDLEPEDDSDDELEGAEAPLGVWEVFSELDESEDSLPLQGTQTD